MNHHKPEQFQTLRNKTKVFLPLADVVASLKNNRQINTTKKYGHNPKTKSAYFSGPEFQRFYHIIYLYIYKSLIIRIVLSRVLLLAMTCADHRGRCGTWRALTKWCWQQAAVEALPTLMSPGKSRTAAGWWNRWGGGTRPNCPPDHSADDNWQRPPNPDQSPHRWWPVAAMGGRAAAQLPGTEGAGWGAWSLLIAPQAGCWSRWGGGVRPRRGTRWGCRAVRLGVWAGTRSPQATPRDPTCARIHAPDLYSFRK